MSRQPGRAPAIDLTTTRGAAPLSLSELFPRQESPGPTGPRSPAGTGRPARVLWEDETPPVAPLASVRKLPATATSTPSVRQAGDESPVAPTGSPVRSRSGRRAHPLWMAAGAATGAALATAVLVLTPAASLLRSVRWEAPAGHDAQVAGIGPVRAPSAPGFRGASAPGAAATTDGAPGPATPVLDRPARMMTSRVLADGRAQLSGTALDVAAGRQLWLAVRPDGASRYYPAGAPLRVDADGSFRTTVRPVSGRAAGRGYAVLLLSIDNATRTRFEAYLAAVSGGRAATGLRSLPGSLVLASVTVRPH